MQNVFDAKDAQEYINRINNLTPETQRKWGKMSVDQVLAHLNVAYDLTFTPEKFPKPNFIAKFLLSKFVKPKITNEIPYKQSLPTSPVLSLQMKETLRKKKPN
jgi:hypothetical protein